MTAGQIVPQSLNTTLLALGIVDEPERRRLHDVIQIASEHLLDAIIAGEAGTTESGRGNVGAQTDIIGIDFVLSEVNDAVTPVGIAVSSQDVAVCRCQVYENLFPDVAGEAFRPYLLNAVNRSQRYLVRGMKVLVVGAGGYSKKFIWPSAKEFGIQVRFGSEWGRKRFFDKKY